MRWFLVAALVVVMAATVVALGQRARKSSASFTPPWSAEPAAPSPSLPSSAAKSRRSDHRAAVGEADGIVPGDVTVFDDRYPAVAKLDPDLLKALRQAASDAENDGVAFYVNSGWRSAAYQEQLLREAIAKYGSAKAAARWVSTPATSAHVSGHAVDVGRPNAASWLGKHGAAYGLCQIYRNEAWHFELRPEAVEHGCPRMYADPTQDPRMR